jgi:hypothetical protein
LPAPEVAVERDHLAADERGGQLGRDALGLLDARRLVHLLDHARALARDPPAAHAGRHM